MRIEEAIEKLNRHYVLFLNVPRAELIDAARLGIEALERVKYNSTARFGEYDYSPLPSETEK